MRRHDWLLAVTSIVSLVACATAAPDPSPTASTRQALCIAEDTASEQSFDLSDEPADFAEPSDDPDDGAGKKCSASLKDPSGVSACKKSGDSVTLSVLCYKCGPNGENTDATVTSTCTGCGKAKAPKQSELDKACGK